MNVYEIEIFKKQLTHAVADWITTYAAPSAFGLQKGELRDFRFITSYSGLFDVVFSNNLSKDHEIPESVLAWIKEESMEDPDFFKEVEDLVREIFQGVSLEVNSFELVEGGLLKLEFQTMKT